MNMPFRLKRFLIKAGIMKSDYEKYLDSLEKEKEFLVDRISEWKKDTAVSMVRYTYDTNGEFHVIEVYPEMARKAYHRHLLDERNLIREFMDRFPGKDLLLGGPDPNSRGDELVYISADTPDLCRSLAEDAYDEFGITMGTDRKERMIRVMEAACNRAYNSGLDSLITHSRRIGTVTIPIEEL